ncbi:MAG: Ig-like domain-containing protein, partial [Gammaproteobacteria bacterium]|nr:Ig-like domain-containing protein [Gammaproteobacteria bacterium]
LVPFPNDIFISPTTGKVSLPATALVDDDGNPDFGNPVVAMNQLNGFSTIAPMNARFSAPIDATTLTAESVIIIDITDQAAPSPLIFGADFTAGVSDGSDSNNQVLEIVLLERLDPESQYVVILTKAIQDTGGRNATTDITFQQILDSIAANTTLENAQLELIKDNAIAPLLAVSTGAGVDTANIAVIWSFTTQTIGDSLEAIEGSAAAQTAVLVDTTLNTKDILDPGGTNPALFGIA